MRKTIDLQPKIKAIQEKHKDDKDKANAGVMELYKEHKVKREGERIDPLSLKYCLIWMCFGIGT